MKRLFVMLLALAMLLVLTACGKDAPATQPAATTPVTTPAATEPSKTEPPVTEPAAEIPTIVLRYGTDHYGEYEAAFCLPEGASFDEAEYAEYEEFGYLYTFCVNDTARKYTAFAMDYRSRESYFEDPDFYEIAPQLYFYGELDDNNSAQYENCYQIVTDLGFQWNGQNVLLLETHFTNPGYEESVERFVGVEYDVRYWKVNEDDQTEENLTAPGLIGFLMYSTDVEDLTADQCAWIAGQLFGVDSGRTWDN